MKKITIALISIGIVGVGVANFLRVKHFESSFAHLPITGELLTRFALIDSALDMHAQRTDVWWNDEEGYSILVPSTESILIATTGEGAGVGATVPDKYFSEELAIAKQVFMRRGFTQNERNSSTSTLDTRFYDYVQAYEKGDELCTVSVNPDNGSYQGSDTRTGYTLEVSCGNTLATAQAQQRPFLDALEYRNKEAVVRVANQRGVFFEVSTHFRRVGQTAVLKREESGYRVLFITQEAPPCAIVDAERIPFDVLSSVGRGACYTDAGVYRDAPI